MSSFLLSSQRTPPKSSPSPARRSLVAHPETIFSPLRSKEKNRELAKERLRQKRQEAALTARGGVESMTDDFLLLQHKEELRQLERDSLDHFTRPEDYDEFQNQVNDSVQNEADLLDSLLMQEEEEMMFLISQQEQQERDIVNVEEQSQEHQQHQQQQ